jgi:hypothetical protein
MVSWFIIITVMFVVRSCSLAAMVVPLSINITSEHMTDYRHRHEITNM